MPTWIDTANREPKLIDRMRALLRAENSVSFAELGQLDGFRGDHSLRLGEEQNNLVLWSWVSAQAIADLETMIAGGECHIAPASVLTYICDGALLNLPIAKRRIAYKRPHWLPACLLRGPAPSFEEPPRRKSSRQKPSPRAPNLTKRSAVRRKRVLVPGRLRAGR